MKQIALPLIIFAFLMAAWSQPAPAQQQLKIAVVDMKRALTDYHKTKTEVDAINKLGEEKVRNIDERKAAYAKLTSEMVEVDKTVRATELSEDKRKAAGLKLQELAEARAAKANEITDAERLASQELFQARQRMEQTLLDEIRAAVSLVVSAKGFDLVFDRSFLPKSRKMILYASSNVIDVTDEVIAKLNSGVPAGN